MHSEETQPPPPLPRRATDQAIAAALPLWGEAECCDRETLELCLEGLRALDTPTTTGPQSEIDGVIARWRAAHPSEVRRAR
ncbi:hypothetical protein [Nocardia carnea]|uniref:Uncharacterized protein n=1 Tax=Nocardia carnea TaxID=37328 RepID=A0ABW7TL53_9NOCA|nr:hypothetical protein [Nocardia carnea]